MSNLEIFEKPWMNFDYGKSGGNFRKDSKLYVTTFKKTFEIC